MDLSLLRSTSILNKYSLNAIPRDGEGSDSGPGDSWGGDNAGVAFTDSGNYFSAFDAGNNFSGGFDSNTFDSGGWNGSWDGGSTFSGNNFDGGGWGGGGVSYGDAGLGPGGFGTGGFGFNGGAFDYGGGNAFTGLGPGGGGWDAGPWGAGTFGYDQGFGGLYSNPAMDAWGPGSYSAWAGFGEPSGGFNNFMGPFGDQSGWSMPSGAQFNQGYMGYQPGSQEHFANTFDPYTALTMQYDAPMGNVGTVFSPGRGDPNNGFNGNIVQSDLLDAQNNGLHGIYQAFGPPGVTQVAPLAYDQYAGRNAPLDPYVGVQRSMDVPDPSVPVSPAVPFDQVAPPTQTPTPNPFNIGPTLYAPGNELAYAGGKDQGQFNPNNNPLGYPSSVWDAASYFGGGNVTNQAQNSRDSFDSRYGEWGVPNANPNISNVIANDFRDSFNSRYGDFPSTPALNPGIYGDLYDVGPTNVFGPASVFGGGGPVAYSPLSAPDSFDLGEQGRAGSFPAARAPTQGDTQVAYDFLSGGPNAGPQLGLGGPLSGLVSTYDNPFSPGAANFDSRFGGPYAPSTQWTSDMYLGPDGKGDLRGPAATFDARFGDLPPAVNGIPNSQEFARPTAQQELGDRGYTPLANPIDFEGYGPAGTTFQPANPSGIYGPYAPVTDMSPLQQAIESRGGIMPTLDETGRSINDVMDAARAAQLNNQNMGREQNYPTLQEFLGDGRTAPPSRSGYDVVPSRDGDVSTRGGRADLSPDNSREAAQTARSVTQSIARGDPNSMAYLNSLLNEARTAPTLAGRIAALDALNGIISAMKDAGRPNPFGRDPDPFIASQLRMGR